MPLSRVQNRHVSIPKVRVIDRIVRVTHMHVGCSDKCLCCNKVPAKQIASWLTGCGTPTVTVTTQPEQTHPWMDELTAG